MLLGLLQVVAVARLTLVELDFLVEVEVEALLEIDVTFLVEVLISAEDDDDFFVDVVIDLEDDVVDFRNPATKFVPAATALPAEFFNQHVPSPMPCSPPTYVKATQPDVPSQAVIQPANDLVAALFVNAPTLVSELHLMV